MAYTHIMHNKPKEKFVCAINALSDLFFVAYFDKSGIKLKEEKMIARAEFEKIALQKVVLRDDMPFSLQDKKDFLEIDLSGRDLLDFAEKLSGKEKFTNLADFNPTYLRLSQAEDQMLKKNKKSAQNS